MGTGVGVLSAAGAGAAARSVPILLIFCEGSTVGSVASELELWVVFTGPANRERNTGFTYPF